MNVVAHQPVGINPKTVALPVLPPTLQLVFPVPVAVENHLALIAPANHMIKRARIFNSRFRPIIALHQRASSINQYESLTGIFCWATSIDG